eukprot:TRINITY_DN4559_c0_g1_i2.p1 TRINITY_DN4559_c0_g1~~TRINITY_DN4559_c0_g1_i2.p1  ORF type:complete len:619 (-),score=180.29 TRINITY_DN4559_c0_g1_i2:120-1976(-)
MFQQMTEISIGFCKLTELPSSMKLMPALKIVNFNHNALTSFPTCFPPTTSEINLSYNEIAGELSVEKNQYNDLRCLNLSFNQLTSIAKETGHLSKSLRFFDIGFNKLPQIPEELGLFQTCCSMSLVSNNLNAVPAGLGVLHSLQFLYLTDNNLSDLPQSFTALCALQLLQLNGNAFSRFPPPVFAMPALKKLMLARNKISFLPSAEQMCCLKTLEVLDLSLNSLTDVSGITCIQSLLDLNFSFNKIRAVPRGIHNLGRLIALNMSNNWLTELPEELRQMETLSELLVSHNNIAEVNPKWLASKTWVRYEGNPELDRKSIVPFENNSRKDILKGIRAVAGWSEMCGRRPEMQDAVCVMCDFQGVTTHHFAAVFDGHSGNNVARFSSHRMGELVATKLNTMNPIDTLESSFATIQKEIEGKAWADGSTGVVALLVEHTLYVANIGDSRAMLVRGGRALQISYDHKPDTVREKQRIRAGGGHVINSRTNGELALSRALGDCALRPAVAGVPEIHCRHMEPTDEFVVLACDGVWDVLSCQQVADIVTEKSDPARAASAVRDAAFNLTSGDNISVVVMALSHPPQPLGGTQGGTTTQIGVSRSSTPATVQLGLRGGSPPGNKP